MVTRNIPRRSCKPFFLQAASLPFKMSQRSSSGSYFIFACQWCPHRPKYTRTEVGPLVSFARCCWLILHVLIAGISPTHKYNGASHSYRRYISVGRLLASIRCVVVFVVPHDILNTRPICSWLPVYSYGCVDSLGCRLFSPSRSRYLKASFCFWRSKSARSGCFGHLGIAEGDGSSSQKLSLLRQRFCEAGLQCFRRCLLGACRLPTSLGCRPSTNSIYGKFTLYISTVRPLTTIDIWGGTERKICITFWEQNLYVRNIYTIPNK